MILPHTFDAATHTYRVEGRVVLSTSDVIYLNGLADYGPVPASVLQHASWRGTELHRAIQFFEEDGEAPDMDEEVEPYFRGYCKFKLEYDFEPIGALEREIVYEHDGTGQAVGCTIDLRGLVRGTPYIVDAKTTAKQYGKAKAQKLLAWRLQTQSYICATEFDEEWIDLAGKHGLGRVHPSRGIVHVDKNGLYEFHDFGRYDDSAGWDSAVRMAMLKLANGYDMKGMK